VNHLFVGAFIPFLIGMIIYALKKGRISIPWLILMPFFMLLGATWAVIPDLPRTFGSVCPNLPFGLDWQALDAKMASASNPWIDIFFWHYSINLHESNSILFTLGFIAMLGTLFWIAWRELFRAEYPDIQPSKNG
jgi:hypothetical protein